MGGWLAGWQHVRELPAPPLCPTAPDAQPLAYRGEGSVMTLLAWCVAWLLDVIIGDPQRWPHPVRWIGNLINTVHRGIRRCCHSDAALRVGGGVMWLAVVGLTWGMAWGVLALGRWVHPW